MKNYLFSIVITTKNRYTMLLGELDCLTKQEYKAFKVYIVDDNSNDDTCTLDAARYKTFFDIEFVHNKTTLNMIKSRNRGLELADKNSDYFMILDDDNLFDKDYLLRFNTFLNKYPNFGLIGPKNYHKNRKSIFNFGCDYNLSTLFPRFGKKEFEEDYLIVDAVANCFLIKSSLFKEIGFFDEKYVIDFSETEYAYRAKELDYKTCVANIPIYHQGTTGKGLEIFRNRIETRPETYFYTVRNKYLFVSEFGSLHNKIMFYCVFQFVSLVGYMCVSVGVGSTKLFSLYFKGFWAGNIYIHTGELLDYGTFGRIKNH